MILNMKYKISIGCAAALLTMALALPVYAGALEDAESIRKVTSAILRVGKGANPKKIERVRKVFAKNPEAVAIFMDDTRRNAAAEKLGVPGENIDFQSEKLKLVSDTIKMGWAYLTPGQVDVIVSALKYVAENTPEAILSRIAIVLKSEVEAAVTQMKLEKMPVFHNSLESLFDPQSGVKFKGLPSDCAKVFKHLVTRYFGELSPKSQKKIVRDYLQVPVSQRDESTIIRIALENSGPMLQKVFQLIGDDAESPRLKEALNELKSSLPAMTDAELSKVLHGQFGGKFDEIFSEFDRKPVKAATIGQVHLARLKGTNERVAVKIQRPGLLKKIEQEERVFLDAVDTLEMNDAEKARLQAYILKAAHLIKKELDVLEEAENLRRANHVYNEGRISVVQPHDLPYALRKDVVDRILVMTLAAGKRRKFFLS